MFVEEKEVGEVKELDEAAKVLLKAADIIDRAGLHKYSLDAGNQKSGPVCLIGGILRALCGTTAGWGQDHPHYHLVLSLSYRVHPKRAEWNDAPERTKAEVVARMRTKALAG